MPGMALDVRKTCSVAAVIAAVTLASASSYASPGHGEPDEASARPFRAGEPARAAEADRTVRISARDMEFGKHEIDIHAGETVRFVVTNTGKLRHEFVIGTAAEQEEHAEAMAKANARMPHDHANAILMKPGETKEIVWTFSDVDDARFACLIPGHYEAGMWGEFDIHG